MPPSVKVLATRDHPIGQIEVTIEATDGKYPVNLAEEPERPVCYFGRLSDTALGAATSKAELALSLIYPLKAVKAWRYDQLIRMATIWEGCEEIEQVPGKTGGRPVIKGTRIEPETILTDAELGASPEETHESFPTVPLAKIRRIIEFARSKLLVS